MMTERTDPTKGSGPDMRILLLLGLCSYAVLLMTAAIFRLPERMVLQGLGVPALEHPFMDLRGVAAWCESFRQGQDPSITRTWVVIPGAPAQPNFLMNYSPLVLGFSWLGLSPACVFYCGIVLGMMFFAGAWMLAGHCTLSRACLWVLLICSPDAILVVERGNLDILIFILMVVALVLRDRPGVTSLLLLTGALLKFFPIVSLLPFWWKKERNARIAAVIALIVFLLYLCSIHSRILSIGGSLSGQCHSAFGCMVLVDLLSSAGVLAVVTGMPFHLILKIVALMLMVLAFGSGCILNEGDKGIFVSARSRYAFFLGAPVMGLLFLMGNQMDYKWIFFLFMVPAALELVRGTSLLGARLGSLWICGMMAYSWWTFFSDEGSLRNALLKQAVMWGVMIFGGVLAGLLWRERKFS